MRLHPLEKRKSQTPTTIQPPNPQHIYNAALALLFNRCFTATMSICLLGLTASYISVEGRTDIGVLTGLRFYVACTTISTLATLYGLFISLPLLRNHNPRMDQTQACLRILHKRWTWLGIDTVLLGLWIAAAVVAKGSVPHFYTKGVNLTAFGIVMALFELWAIGTVLFARGFRKART